MSRFLDPRWERLVPYVPGEQPLTELVKLNTNESPYPPSPGVEKLLQEQATDLAGELRLYPDPAAKELLAALHQAYPGVQGSFFPGNGSDEVLATLFMAYGTKRKVYYPKVSYGFYPVYAAVYGSKAVEVPLRGQEIDPADYRENDGMIVIANPNAPTGLALLPEQIETILSANPDHPVVIDEAYVDFGAHTCLPLLQKYENLIVVQTFSKSRSLAGLRFGFAAAGAAVIADLNRLQFARNPYPVGRLTTRLAIAALADSDYFDTCRNEIMKTREYTAHELRRRGFEVNESRANFLWVCPTDLPARYYFEKLRDRKILVRYFDADGLRDRLRITIGTLTQMDLLLAAVSAIQRSAYDKD